MYERVSKRDFSVHENVISFCFGSYVQSRVALLETVELLGKKNDNNSSTRLLRKRYVSNREGWAEYDHNACANTITEITDHRPGDEHVAKKNWIRRAQTA